MRSTLQYAFPRLQRLWSQLGNLPRTLKLVWEAAPRWTSAWIAGLFVQGLLPVLLVYLTRQFVDVLVAAVRNPTWSTSRPAMTIGLALAAVMLASHFLEAIINWIRTAQAELVQDHITNSIHDQSTSVDLAFYEVPEYYDHLHRARVESTYRPVALLDNIGGLLQNGLTLGAMLLVLIPYGAVLPIALLISSLPALLVALRWSERQHEWRQRMTPDERRAWYYDSILTDGQNAAETRAYGLASHFSARYKEIRTRLRTANLRLSGSQLKGELAAGGFAFGVTGGALLWMVWRTAQGTSTLGQLALVYQAFNQGLSLTRAALGNLGRVYENSLFLGNLFEFLSLRPSIGNPKDPQAPSVSQDIEFRGVHFKYPGNESPVLSDFNLTVKAGEIVAIVGPNGAGKTTLVKLLARFYDPDEGDVTLGGVPLRRMNLENVRRSIGIMLQTPVRFAGKLRKNVWYGDIDRADKTDAIDAALQASGGDQVAERLPEGIETVLGRVLESGSELSVGEWQRVGMARAFFSSAPVLVLDEPTSAMDPWSEAEWLRSLREHARGRTIILVTHRLTTAMRADSIHVVSDGRVVESGSHDELCARGGNYAKIWESQHEVRQFSQPA